MDSYFQQFLPTYVHQFGHIAITAKWSYRDSLTILYFICGVSIKFLHNQMFSGQELNLCGNNYILTGKFDVCNQVEVCWCVKCMIIPKKVVNCKNKKRSLGGIN